MEQIYTVNEAAKLLKTSRNNVYDFIKSGELKAIKIGSIKIKESDLQKFINKL